MLESCFQKVVQRGREFTNCHSCNFEVTMSEFFIKCLKPESETKERFVECSFLG